jgi:hypothetical protein
MVQARVEHRKPTRADGSRVGEDAQVDAVRDGLDLSLIQVAILGVTAAGRGWLDMWVDSRGGGVKVNGPSDQQGQFGCKRPA